MVPASVSSLFLLLVPAARHSAVLVSSQSRVLSKCQLINIWTEAVNATAQLDILKPCLIDPLLAI